MAVYAETPVANRLAGTDFCIPDRYAVRLEIREQADDELYDTSPGFDLNAKIHYNEAAKHLDGYVRNVADDGLPQYQTLYLGLRPAPKTESVPSRSVEDPTSLTTLTNTKDLFITDKVPSYLVPTEVLKKTANDNYITWGTCSRTSHHNQPAVYACQRRNLIIDSVAVEYNIHQANLSRHEGIDEFIRQKFESWQCEQSTDG